MNLKNLRSNTLRALAASFLIGLLLAGCGDTPAATTAPAAATATTAPSTGGNTGAAGGPVQVSLFEWGIEPKNLEVTGGKQTIEVINKGKFPHDYTINVGTETKKTPVLAAGETATLEIDVAAGTYEVVCSVPGHAPQGMTGTLVVK